MNDNFNFTCMISCMLILKQFQRRNILLLRLFVENHKKMSTPGPVQKYWLGFSYIHLEDYELYNNFDDT